MTRKHRIGFIGAGFMATEHAKAFASFPEAEIAGIVGRSPERAQAFADLYGCPIYADVAQLHAEGAVDAVVVAVPELSCREVCEQVFRHDWISLLEKPVGLHYREARELLAAAEAAEHEAYVALNRRAYSATRAANDALGDEGKRFIVVTDTQDLNVARQVGQPEAVVDNWMFANSIHLVDYLRFFGRGEVVSVEVTSRWNAADPGPVVATVTFGSGDVGLYQGAWNAPGPWAVTVTNAEVRAELRPLEQLGVQRLGERRLTPIDTHAEDIEFKAGLRHQARMLLARLDGGASDLPTLADATGSMELVARIYDRLD